jgi:hypothetical protein
MKRKLIDFDVYSQIKTESLSRAQSELESAAHILAEALGLEVLSLDSYGSDHVLYETEEGEFVRADYSIKNGQLQFDNIEQLVINEETEVSASRDVISKMIDALVESDDNKAGELFAEWMDLPRSRKMFIEGEYKLRRVPKRKRVGPKGRKKTVTVGWTKERWKVGTPDHHMSRTQVNKMQLNRKKNRIKKGKARLNAEDNKRKKIKLMKECGLMAENVLNFVNYTVNGPEVDLCRVLRNEGEIVAARIPTERLRNEARILRFDWKTMNTDVAIKRSSAKRLSENNEFVKEVAELRRLNALSDNKGLEEAIEKFSTTFPDSIYLTEAELAGQIKIALETAGANNYDDETCRFLSEGILRTICESFGERVTKIAKLAGVKLNDKSNDQYAEFKSVAEGLYSNLDESAQLEMQAFVDVYEALRSVHELAKEEGNREVAEHTALHLDDLLSIIENKSDMDLEILGEAAEWLYEIVEATAGEEWNVAAPVVSATGEHPEVAKKGRTSEVGSETPDAHHTSDGKDYKGAAAKELEGEGWSNIGGQGVYPELDNPYVPKAEHPKMKGEKDIDSDSDQLATWGSGDTWPSLQNPYSKDSVTPKEPK